jgi:putative endonuclease
MSYSLYILRCGDGSLYTGIALDVARRLEEHPVELVFEQPAGDRAAAQRLEHRVKSLSRAEKEALIGGDLSSLRAVQA